MTISFPKSNRDDRAKLALQFARILPVSEAVSCIKAAFSVSETTARHLIRRGVFLAVNQGAE
jgi:hypothetical protein